MGGRAGGGGVPGVEAHDEAAGMVRPPEVPRRGVVDGRASGLGPGAGRRRGEWGDLQARQRVPGPTAAAAAGVGRRGEGREGGEEAREQKESPQRDHRTTGRRGGGGGGIAAAGTAIPSSTIGKRW